MRLAVDREIERLPHLGRLAERALGLVVADVDGHALIAELDRGRQLELRIGAHVLDVGREHALDQVESAGFQIGEPHRGVDDRQEHDAVDEDVVLVPVVGEFLEHDAVLLHALDELVGTGADRMQAELVAGLLGRLRRHHHAGAVGELRDQRRERRLQHQLDGEGIDHLDMVDARRAPACGTSPACVMWRSSENFAASASNGSPSWNLTLGPQLDRHLLAVGGGLVRQRELRHDVELLVDVEQLVAERRRTRCGRHRCAPCVGSRMSGSSARPMRSVVWAWRRACKRQQQAPPPARQTQDLHR